jgi:hypothetical protein
VLRYALALWSAGAKNVAGLDQAGMSPGAGPVAVGAVVFFRPGIRIHGVVDSKKIDSLTRERITQEIRHRALAWSVGFVEVEEIDRINIYYASLGWMANIQDTVLQSTRVTQSAIVPPFTGSAHVRFIGGALDLFDSRWGWRHFRRGRRLTPDDSDLRFII